MDLLRAQLEDLLELLDDPPPGYRPLRVGQFWSDDSLQGKEGHILEVLGIMDDGRLNGRR